MVLDESGYILYFRKNLFYVDEETLVVRGESGPPIYVPCLKSPIN